MTSAQWFANLEGKAKGIFTDEEVISLINDGKLTKGSLVWKKGMASWQPIELHFGDFFEKERSIDGEREKPRSEAQDKQLETSEQTAQRVKPAYLLLSFVFAVASVVGFLWLRESAEMSADNSNLVTSWFSTLMVSVLCLLWLLVMSWKSSNYYWTHDRLHKRAGLLRLFSFFGAIGLLVYFGVFGYAGFTLIQISKARSAYNKYTVDVDPASNTISISGLIGPDLSRRIIDNLKIHSDTRAIYIDSPGGLIDEGLAAAKFIEKIPQATVIAHDMCNSACLLILMSAQNRLATWNMKLGFHAAGAITDVGDYTEMMISGLGEDSYTYLVKRGVPTSIVEKAKLKGTDRLEMVSAIDLFESGALTGLVDGESKLDIDTAKWRFVEDIFAGGDGLNLSLVLSAIREGAPSYVKKYAGPLYSAISLNDREQIKNVMGIITGSIVQEALVAAEGSALNRYIAIQFLQMRHLAKLEQWKYCVDYSNGNIGEAQSALSRDLHEKEFEAQAALIRSAALKKWKAQPIPSWVERKSTSIYEEIFKKSFELGFLDAEGNFLDAKGNCLYLLILFEKILDQDDDTAAPILRALLTQE
jgi:ATP-dependent protease ClpP protease subunit